MYRFESRAVKAAMMGMLVTLAACVDQPTEPSRQGLEPSFGVGDVLTVTNLSGAKDIGSLRWVLSQATGGEVIRFDPSLAGKTITLDTTIVFCCKPITIEGPADKGITISGGGTVTVFHLDLDPGSEIVLRNLTIANGGGPKGGGIFVSGYPTAWVRIENSTITGNVAPDRPAINGISTILVNTTVSGNTATSSVGGTAVYSNNLTVVNSTIAHNASAGVASGNLVMRNSIISNHGGNDNCASGSLANTYEGSNISDDDSCGSVFDITIADPMLAPLADHGGPGKTHALMAGSPAINAGTSCTVAVDQRYAPRDAQCDIGAFEFIDFTTVDLTVASSATFDANGYAVVTGTVRCSRGETFDLQVELRQSQKNGKDIDHLRAFKTFAVGCSTGLQSWGVAVGTSDGAFQNGDAVARVITLNTGAWVTPVSVSQAVKLFKGRR